MITSENAAQAAAQLMTTANFLGSAINLVDAMGREGWAAIDQESDNADLIVLQGTEVMRALRSLAMRLDRSVLIQTPEQQP